MRDYIQGWNLFRSFLLMATISLSYLSVSAQKTITGKVTGTNGEPFPGVSIILKGTSTGTTTNSNGVYSIRVPDYTSVLVFSSVGYTEVERVVGDNSVINIQLQPSATLLDETVIIGYGTRSKEALTGSVVNVNMDDLKKMNPVNNITNALQGMVPGLVANSANTPGAGANIQIRGIGTINNTSPLVIVDGIPSDIGRLNPAEIKSITVLKDAASTAIYGSRGANGVIVVTTAMGEKNQKAKVTLGSHYSISSLPPQYDMLNPKEFGEQLWMSYKNSGITPNDHVYGNGATPVIPKYIYPAVTNDMDLSKYNYPNYQIVESTPDGGGTNPFDYIFQNGISQDYDMTITGGTDKLKYAIVSGYTNDIGEVIETGFKRFNFRVNTSLDLRDWLKIGENIGVRYENRWGLQSDGGEGSVIARTLQMPRYAPINDIQGHWAPVTKIVGINSTVPPELWRQSDFTNKYLSIDGNAYLKLLFLKNFTAVSTLGLYGGNGWTNQPLEANPWDYSGTNIDILTVGASKALTWDWTNTINYTKRFGAHSIDVMVGSEASYSRSDDMSASRQKYFLTTPEYFVLSAGEGTQTNSGGYSESTLASYFGRLHYGFKNKYFFDGVLRQDGSSVFAKNYRWGTFPSFAGGWIISREGFMNSVNWLDLLKIRASWGQSGNNRIGTYNGFSTYQTNINYSYYPIDGSVNHPTSGFESKAFGNPNARWETTTTINFGLDVNFLKNFIMTLDVWQRETTDMLYPKAIPAVFGDALAPSVNVGDMRNTGFDLSVSYKGSAFNHNFTYNINLIASHYKNELVSLSDNADEVLYGSVQRDQYYTYAKKGTSFPEFYGYKVLGIFQTNEEADAYYPNELDPTYNKPGHFKFADVNGDKVINSDDRTSIGSPHPDLTLGLNLSFGYKNFDLLATIYSSIGNDALNIDRRSMDFNYLQFWRGTRRLYESWGSPYLKNNADAKMPIAEINDQISELPSSYYVEDASYIRLNNLQLGYTFSNNSIKKIGLENLRLFVVGQNLITITGYDGLDPAFYNSGINFGIDGGRWPSLKSYMIGVNATF